MADHRTLVLVDIENVMGGANPTPEVRARALDFIESLRAPGALVVVAASHHAAAGLAWEAPRVRWRWRSGPDGADRCLLEVLAHERVAERFDHLTLVSGDGIFAQPLAQLATAGVRTTVMSAAHQLSHRLRLAAHDVVTIGLISEESHDAA